MQVLSLNDSAAVSGGEGGCYTTNYYGTPIDTCTYNGITTFTGGPSLGADPSGGQFSNGGVYQGNGVNADGEPTDGAWSTMDRDDS
jgi:hypothetical protein